MNTNSYKTQSTKPKDVKRAWHLIDMDGQIVGRTCTHVATLLRGKHKPSYTPNIDTGDYVVVINSAKARFTGKKVDQKEYITYSGYPGGQKRKTAKMVFESKPNYVIENAVKGMLPKTKLGRAMFKKLFVYEGAEHPHSAQSPKKFEI